MNQPVDLDSVRRQHANQKTLIDEVERRHAPLSTSGGDGTSLDMDRIGQFETRMKGVETAVDGLRYSQNMMLGILGLAVTIGIFGGGYLLTRVDALGGRIDTVSEKLNALPDQINKNLLDLNRTLSDSITAARSAPQQPQVIVVQPSPGAAIPPQ